jgi:hypothetical protein
MANALLEIKQIWELLNVQTSSGNLIHSSGEYIFGNKIDMGTPICKP